MRFRLSSAFLLLTACADAVDPSGGGGIQAPESEIVGSTSGASGGGSSISSGGGAGHGGDPSAGGTGGGGGDPFDPDGPDPLCPTAGGEGGDAGPDACGQYLQTYCRVKDELGCRRNGGTWLPCSLDGACYDEAAAWLDCLTAATTDVRCECVDDGTGGGGGLDAVAMHCGEREACALQAEALDGCREGR